MSYDISGPFLSFCISKSHHYLSPGTERTILNPADLNLCMPECNILQLIHPTSSVKLELYIQMSSQRQSVKDCGRKPLQSNYSFFNPLKHLQKMALALVFVLCLKGMDWKRDDIFMAYTNIFMFPDYSSAGANFHVTICNSQSWQPLSLSFC